METNTLSEELVEADVLCIGGGIAGLMAAIRASELGAKVVVAEKGNALGSGRGRAGNDHFQCYIPEAHGYDIEAFLDTYLKQTPRLKAMLVGASMKMLLTYFERSFDIVKLWDSWGIPMKYNGKWEFAGHTFPGDIHTFLKYSGKNQKRILVKKALEKGVKIINRVMVYDLLSTGGDIVGAIGIHTRENKAIVFQTDNIILGTGFVDRMYPPPVPGWLASVAGGLTLTGDGRAMAYRAGGELVGMELCRRHMGPKYFSRFGQATWVGVLKDPKGKPIGPYFTRPDRKYSDVTAEVSSVILEDYMKSGRGPVYMDCRGITDEDYEYMMYWQMNEGNTALINHMREEGIDLRRNPVEFSTYHMNPEGKIPVNEKAETSLKGLYAAGDESIIGIGSAATYGWIAGECAARHARERPISGVEKARNKIEEKKNLASEIISRDAGPDWYEANILLQQIMQDYAGPVRSETLLEAGLSHLRRLTEKVNTTLMARNHWELTRCLETLNLLDLGELIFVAANERKETRGLHRRPDYPLTDPTLDDKVLFIKQIEGRPVTEWRRMG